MRKISQLTKSSRRLHDSSIRYSDLGLPEPDSDDTIPNTSSHAAHDFLPSPDRVLDPCEVDEGAFLIGQQPQRLDLTKWQEQLHELGIGERWVDVTNPERPCGGL